MDVKDITNLYIQKKINAKEALEILTKSELLPDAFMQLLVDLYNKSEAYDSLL